MRILNKWIRKIHRWLVVPFALAIIYLLIDTILGETAVDLPVWFNSMAIGTLLLLLLTGLYLFFLHYLAKWRRNRRAR